MFCFEYAYVRMQCHVVHSCISLYFVIIIVIIAIINAIDIICNNKRIIIEFALYQW